MDNDVVGLPSKSCSTFGIFGQKQCQAESPSFSFNRLICIAAPIYSVMKKHEIEALLKEAIGKIVAEMLAEKKIRKGKKPGGGLTDLGAWKRVSRVKWAGQIRAALDGAGGDIEKTADRLGISVSSTYAALQDEPTLQRAKDVIDKKDDKKEEKKDDKAGEDYKK